MALTATDYRQQLQALLPPGPAWASDEASPITQLLDGLAPELARIDARVLQVVEEADPRTVAALFADWERVAGLPDACAAAFGGGQTDAQRRAALLGRITTLGGQSAAYFTGVANALGFAITITEFREHSVIDDVDAPFFAAEWPHVWRVNSALSTVLELTVDSTVDDPLAAWGNELLECVMNRLTPAQSTVFFSYT